VYIWSTTKLVTRVFVSDTTASWTTPRVSSSLTPTFGEAGEHELASRQQSISGHPPLAELAWSELRVNLAQKLAVAGRRKKSWGRDPG
jgi:hypothetical protein